MTYTIERSVPSKQDAPSSVNNMATERDAFEWPMRACRIDKPYSHMRILWLSVAWVWCTIFPALCGCTREGDSPAPRRDWHTLYRHMDQAPTTLDPAQVKDVAGGRIVAHIYGTLVAYDAGGNLVGDVAERFEVKPDRVTYVFHLRKNLRFANGRDVTPEDVVKSFTRTLSPLTASPRTWVLDRIKGAKASMAGADALPGLRITGERTLEIELEEPFAPFLGLLTMPAAAIVPAEVTDFTNGGFGTGPFRIAEYRSNEQLILARNPHYPGPGPNVDRVVYKIIEPPVARITEFRQGLIDIMDVPGDYYESLAADAETKGLIVRTDAFNVYFVGINCTSERFRSPAVRRAFAHALNVPAIVNALLPGRATPAAGPIPPALPGFDPAFKGISYDPSQLPNIFKQEGYDPSVPARFLCGSDKDTVKICQALAGELRNAGIAVELMPRERGTFKQMLKSGDFDLYYYSWWADYPDAENFLAPLFLTNADRSSGNPTGYSNAEVDALIRRAQAETDAAKRIALYREIQSKAVADCPRVWLWHKQDITIRRPWVKDYRPRAVYNTEKSTLVRIEPPGSAPQ